MISNNLFLLRDPAKKKLSSNEECTVLTVHDIGAEGSNGWQCKAGLKGKGWSRDQKITNSVSMSIFNICNRIFKEGSYRHTTSTQRFYHHSIDTYVIRQSMCACIVDDSSPVCFS